MLKKQFFIFFILVLNVFSEEYEFTGTHLMGDYLECSNSALTDLKKLEKIMIEACIEAKATVLQQSTYIFPPDGFSMIILLQESHASIHTYPEYNSCFVDFFTCGTSCDAKKFDEILKNYLKPKRIREKIFIREDTIKEAVKQKASISKNFVSKTYSKIKIVSK
ncbi:MAG: S-adenosylmethionine decarboxylase proenzyme [Chlamydiae bacterium RIFCSPLOWO2_01_FULL_28_7]|nr:MAG: S-adenosylmethionine decarboxylase proenzyme [Chlamydiae bacterium RIFCSPLOWO2_01_FULL_28_7]